jgi:hypothetical protein
MKIPPYLCILNNKQMNVTSVFSRGELIQVGDLVVSDIEFLNCMSGSGFERYSHTARVVSIEVAPSSLCNSCLLNIGITMSTTEHMLKTDTGKLLWLFETKLAPLSNNKKDRILFLTDYFKHNQNMWVKLKERLGLKDLEDTKPNFNYGRFIAEYNTDVYNYIIQTFLIRLGRFGELTPKNFSHISFDALGKIGYNNYVSNILYQIGKN